jgi:hypothetical protein
MMHDFENRMLSIAREIRHNAISEVLEVLERGCDIGVVMKPAPYDESINARIREQRKRLVERDLYAFHYGDLTPEQCGIHAVELLPGVSA